MYDTVLMFDNCKMLQIGTAAGTTVFHVAPALREIEGLLVTVDIDKSPGGGTYADPRTRNNAFQKQIQDSEYKDLVTYHRDGSDAFFEQNEDVFDIIFIDGDHRYAQSKRDLDNAMQCLSEHGVIFLHDILDRTQGQSRKNSVARVYDEFSEDGWSKLLHKTNHRLAEIRRSTDQPQNHQSPQP